MIDKDNLLKKNNSKFTKYPVRYITITEDNLDQRIDNFLITFLKNIPKSAIYKLLRKGEIRVNKKRIKPTYKLNIGDIVRLAPIEIEETLKDDNAYKNLSQVQELKKEIMYEDDYFLVINKPSKIAVHGGSNISFGVIEALRAIYSEHQYLELAHRIDKETSGILLVAKKRSALKNLHEQFKTKVVKKEYICLVYGSWNSNIKSNNAKLAKKQLSNGDKIVYVDLRYGKDSLTNFKIDSKYKLGNYTFSLMHAYPKTGRTHQIRVHTKDLTHPIVGDPKYAYIDTNKTLKDKYGFDRLFLHAHKISFIHPNTGKNISFTSEISNDLQDFLNKCNKI